MSADAKGITIVGASAGSGKTYRLTQIVSEAIDPSGAQRVGLEGLVAVTYTRKAHAELSARIRRTLVGAGAFDEAGSLPLAYLGTVHAACLRLLQEFAIDAGLSPNVDVAAGDAGKLLRQSLEASLAPEARARLEHLTSVFKLRWDGKIRRTEWLTPVADIMDLARSNRIAAADLPAMAERSAAGLLALLPSQEERDGDALDRALERELTSATKALGKAHDGTKTTQAALDLLAAATRLLRDDAVDWYTWARLANVGASKGCDPLLLGLRDVASRYEAHPRFRAQLRELTHAIYDAARVGLSAYQTWKERRRVVDYVDMLDRALELASHPRVASELLERLELAVVDEFQDTSPIQLALFMKLHGLAGRSVWVGDRKQCIFEYAGADPLLMDAVAGWVTAAGGQQDALSVNYRSRPELVEACSELFAAALARHGFARGEVVVAANRTTPSSLASLPPLGLWAVEASNKDQDAAALAAGVARMLAAPSSTPVVDRTTKEVRAVRPGDVAVLVATNKEAAALADALHARGIRAAIARPGLLSTPEGVLVDAALRWLVDEGDSLAAAKIDALLGFDGRGADAWLEGALPATTGEATDVIGEGKGDGSVGPGGAGESAAVGSRAQATGAAGEARPSRRGEGDPAGKGSGRAEPDDEGDGDGDGEARGATGWRLALGGVRAKLAVLAPSEAVDQVLAALDVIHLCARWPDATQRVANLDALRGLAAGYEDHCEQDREAGTVAGLLRYFDDMASGTLRRDEVIAADDQHVPSDDGAVIVCTYHRAKGLEWPVVVMSSLDRAPRRDAFDDPEPVSEGFDPTRPLAGRWIRYWPWPLSPLKKGPMRDYAEASPEGRRVAEREDKERARLLYVGFTRARDHLVLAARVKTSKPTKKAPDGVTRAECEWLDALADAEGEPLLELPVGASDGAVDVVRIRLGDEGGGVGKGAAVAKANALEVPARVWRLGSAAVAGDREPAAHATHPRWFARPAAVIDGDGGSAALAPPYRISPSNAQADWPELALPSVGAIVALPGAMPLDGKVAESSVLGDAVHAFFATDVEGLTPEERVARARRLLAGAALLGVVRPDALVEASDRLLAFVAARWPGATWHREVAIEACVESAHGERRVAGIIDLLLETAEGLVIVDHKTFPGKGEAAWRKRVTEFLPQFAAYAAALRSIGGRAVIGGWVHLPAGGGMVEIKA
jgi:ATP-dependent helicase/nuclease subunit A